MDETTINRACTSRLSTVLGNTTPETSVDSYMAAIAPIRQEFGDETLILCLAVELAVAEFRNRGARA